MPQYILFHKPYGVLSQFTPEDGARSLAEFGLPAGVYPAGRLDKDSEGLLLLTDDGPLIEQLLNPRNEKPKTYWALVERLPDEAALQRMRAGLRIEDYTTRPCQAELLAPQPEVEPRDPPVRVRKSVQDWWLAITVVEGKNRQVRKMTAAIGHPTLRLIRRSMANLELGDLAPGQWWAIAREDIQWGTEGTEGEGADRITDSGVAVRYRKNGASGSARGGGGGVKAAPGRNRNAASTRQPGSWFASKK
jgi:23S rRNA pseudouridine2457 synthase